MTNLVTPRPGILDLKPYVPGNAGLDNSRPVMQLASNESALGPSPLAIEAYRTVAARLNRYPDGGCSELRSAIAARYQLAADHLVFANGSEHLIDLICHAYAGPGDDVLFSEYAFLMYRVSTLAAGARPITAPEQNFHASVDALLAAVTPQTRIVFLANPNNPTGTYQAASEIQRLRQQLRADILLVIDSAYAEFVDKADYSAGYELVNDTTPNVIVLHTFSKIFGLAALRAGWGYGAQEVIDVINRIRGAFTVNAPAQAAAVAALNDLTHMRKVKQHNDQWLPWLSNAISELGIRITPSIGNFVLTHHANADTANALVNYLKARDIIVRPMAGFGIPNAVRISVGLEHENHACIEGVRDFLATR
ncbi:MAG: histidinol-phosphate transaminase [Gammaproteobacteria bacterium]|nr:histidinol-phosphate transaminase [Gammaproteobacteria bacterium]